MARIKKLRSEFFRRKKLFIPVLALLALLLLTSVIYAQFEIRYSGKIYPNVYFRSTLISGKSPEDASATITKTGEERLQSEIRYILQDGRTILLGKVGDFASYDVKQTTTNAYLLGRHGNLFQQLSSQLHMLRYAEHVAPVYAYNRQDFEQRFNDAFRSYEKPVINSQLILQGDSVVLTPSQAGFVADRERAVSEFEEYLALQRDSSTFDIAVSPQSPEFTQENSRQILETVQGAVNRQITLSSSQLPGSTWTLTKPQLLSFIDLKKENGKIGAEILDYKVASWSAQIAQLINRDPVDAKFQFNGTRVEAFEPAQPGLELDSEALTNKISDAAFHGENSSTVEIPLKITQPALSTEYVNNYGIKELVSSGKSKFVGSPSGRIHNIELAASRLNGALIAPGETFSMYKVVGEVEKSTGFEDAFVILNGRTVPGVGGGLCQVSTTLFRAVLNAGLPIVERHQHAYRVYYYEQDSAPGIDAAVYFPSWDFKFKNDTGNYLLLQTKVDTKKMSAEFNLYGVKDGRTVALTKPIVSNQSPPPPELRMDDPTLPRGQEKEVDHAVWGADTVFSRTVTKDGAQYLQDTFKSAYRPWQRVVMVGVKDN